MSTWLKSMAAQIKAARERKGLSQRALGERVGLPQSHISKIENAAVDLQTSSLVEIARALDMELALLPRQALPAIQALQGTHVGEPSGVEPLVRQRVGLVVSRARELGQRHPRTRIFKLLVRTAQDILQLHSVPAQEAAPVLDLLNRILDHLKRVEIGKKTKQLSEVAVHELEILDEQLRSLRNAIAHGVSRPESVPLPAYRLEDDDVDG